MILEKKYATTAQWSKNENSWLVASLPIYCWVDCKGTEISEWFAKIDDALQFAITNTQGEKNESHSLVKK